MRPRFGTINIPRFVSLLPINMILCTKYAIGNAKCDDDGVDMGVSAIARKNKIFNEAGLHYLRVTAAARTAHCRICYVTNIVLVNFTYSVCHYLFIYI